MTAANTWPRGSAAMAAALAAAPGSGKKAKKAKKEEKRLRKAAGQAINLVKAAIEAALDERKAALSVAELNAKLEADERLTLS